jgi:hypothetical protein
VGRKPTAHTRFRASVAIEMTGLAPAGSCDDQTRPFQCINSFSWIAHTFVGDEVLMDNQSGPGGCPVSIAFQLLPFQCRTSATESSADGKYPDAHALVEELADIDICAPAPG